ncbi:hypothetical protein TEQG_08752 [Trichophyton equinum CBS 127.97]|uniref:Uncharacterized protein n=1 Tax=Trichophyton equinum (strain ATCC MYA-4606 / CBS 127.97) TaxID=559882 RepID=F2PZM3_TRIEC|nr:hypothetical protein TEQG_08752 [Trichophyton equinum CBS 127.97]
MGLLTIPVELLDEITGYLSYFLLSRCPMIKPRDLFEIEMWPGYLRQANIQMAHAHGYFACGEGREGRLGRALLSNGRNEFVSSVVYDLAGFPLEQPSTLEELKSEDGIFCSRCLRYEEYVRHEEHEGYDYSNMSGTCGRCMSLNIMPAWHYPGYQKSAEDYHAEARYYSQFAAYYARPPF